MEEVKVATEITPKIIDEWFAVGTKDVDYSIADEIGKQINQMNGWELKRVEEYITERRKFFINRSSMEGERCLSLRQRIERIGVIDNSIGGHTYVSFIITDLNKDLDIIQLFAGNHTQQCLRKLSKIPQRHFKKCEITGHFFPTNLKLYLNEMVCIPKNGLIPDRLIDIGRISKRSDGSLIIRI